MCTCLSGWRSWREETAADAAYSWRDENVGWVERLRDPTLPEAVEQIPALATLDPTELCNAIQARQRRRRHIFLHFGHRTPTSTVSRACDGRAISGSGREGSLASPLRG